MFPWYQSLWFKILLSPVVIRCCGIIRYAFRRWRCEACGSLRGVQLESSRTMYHTSSEPLFEYFNPNRSVGLCRPCAKEHHLNWDEMWDEYYRGRL